MSFLHAFAADGSPHQFARNELAYFFSTPSVQDAVAEAEGRSFQAEGVVFGGLRFFVGEFMIRDFMPLMPPKSSTWVSSDQCPAPPYASLKLPRDPPTPEAENMGIDPYGAVLVVAYSYFAPISAFREIPPVDAVNWLNRRCGYVPERAEAALDMIARVDPAAIVPAGSKPPPVTKPKEAPPEAGRQALPVAGRKQADAENRAMAVALAWCKEGRKLSVSGIAQEVGCTREYLHRRKNFTTFLATLGCPKSSLPRGRKSRGTGELEAWEDD
ncbi:MAG: hypothetical protein P4L85_02665 [Paludisphaera borealis]|uniref:hypothetical protein n=1 Tax=Paludisphaera borealis TaxID=1387353 RepID=UPI002848C928|nr:hypothetical protein [Paludisphaera borealis]MDR3618224.1 hypothetical protein [Paludisphaera borealis]